MTDSKVTPVEAQAVPDQPVAVIGSDFTLLYASAEPIAEIARRHSLRVGTQLFTRPTPAAADLPTDDTEKLCWSLRQFVSLHPAGDECRLRFDVGQQSFWIGMESLPEDEAAHFAGAFVLALAGAFRIVAASPAAAAGLSNQQVRKLMQVALKWAGPDENDGRSDDLEMALRAVRVAASPPAAGVPTYNFASFDSWWEDHGQHNAVHKPLNYGRARDLMKLSWGVAREVAASPVAPAGAPTEDYFWLVELRPAFEGHPSFPATYYAGWKEGIDAAKTTDPHAAPKFTRKEDAERVAAKLGHTLSCVWKAVEHGFTRPTPAAAAPQQHEPVVFTEEDYQAIADASDQFLLGRLKEAIDKRLREKQQ